MKLYLVRHGEAAATGQGGERPLTEKGRQETERVAEVMGRLGLRVRAIEHSGKLRAKETAQIIAKGVESDEGVVEAEGLMPDDDVGTRVQDLKNATDDTVLVGHLPFISKLASKLLTGDETAGLFRFEPSSVLCLERTEDGDWQVLYFLSGSLG
jgi:phosphohistidine phosphatase